MTVRQPPYEIVCVIPARGGSKGIPRKNLQTVGGIPLVVRTIRQALAAELGDVIVSTDDQEIEELALSAGAAVHKRSSEVSSDTASSESVLLEVSHDLLSEKTKIIVFLQCTAPFLLSEDIIGCVRLVEKGYHSVFAASMFHGCLWQHDDEMIRVMPVNHSKLKRSRRQEMGTQWLESGSVYAMHHAAFLQQKYRFMENTQIYPIPASRTFEIDSWDDLKHARQIASMFDGTPRGKTIYVDIDETICISPSSRNYEQAIPIPEAVSEVNELAKDNKIVFWSARRSVSGKSYAFITQDQLRKWGVKFDEILFGKPPYDMLIDDRARQFPILSTRKH